jgi:hypothetical protein
MPYAALPGCGRPRDGRRPTVAYRSALRLSALKALVFHSSLRRDNLLVWSTLVLSGIDYMIRHQMHPQHPRELGINGWWLWNDQGWYLRSVHAWAAGSLNPAEHWYFPGYPPLGAAFAWLTPIQPFYLPDLFCLIAFGWLFARLAEHLASEQPRARLLGAMVFFVTVALSPLATKSFVEPWTTTPTAPLGWDSRRHRSACSVRPMPG